MAANNKMTWRTNAPILRLKHGIVAGLLAGLTYSLAAAAAGVMMGQMWDGSVRMVAATVLGASALTTADNFPAIFLWGMGLHLAFTMATGILLAWLIGSVPMLRTNGGAAFVASLIYAALMWLSSFYIIAPLFGWTWFPEQTKFLPSLLLQVGVWGGIMAIYFAQRRVREEL